jgi:hypothetical protein
MLSQEEMKNFNRRIAGVEEYFHAELKVAVEYVDILNALMLVLGEKNPEAICKMDLAQSELIRILRNHPFEAPAILGEVRASFVQVPGSIRGIYASLNKSDGTLWEIRGGGRDPFPSDPFAHNEVEDVSMDLSNGRLYHDRSYVHQLRGRALASFRDAVAAACPEAKLPPLSV